jgi:hypothetical protein
MPVCGVPGRIDLLRMTHPADRESAVAMSRYGRMSPRSRRAWGIALLAFFLLLCLGIGVSQWYAENVNVPKYERQLGR